MRRVILVLPGLIGAPEDEPLLKNRKRIQQLAEASQVFALSPLPEVETPEAAFLGLDPHTVRLRQGPLTVAALGADPPDRSVHFHLSTLSLQGGLLSSPRTLSAEEERFLCESAERLNTRSLTFVRGERFDHGLVWEEGSLDMHTQGPVERMALADSLPQGDGETRLRRYIDDSVNLLQESEMNRKREGENQEPINLLWPWGEGFRETVPNLFRTRGEQALVLSKSLRLEGLTRLVGYRHGNRNLLGPGLGKGLREATAAIFASPLTILVVDSFKRLREAQRMEEFEWLSSEIERELISPLFDHSVTEAMRVALLAPGAHGLGLLYDTGAKTSGTIPFDERALEDIRLPRKTLWETISAASKPPVSSS